MILTLLSIFRTSVPTQLRKIVVTAQRTVYYNNCCEANISKPNKKIMNTKTGSVADSYFLDNATQRIDNY